MDSYIAEFEKMLVGKTCTVKRRENSWAIAFDEAGTITIEAIWRIVKKDHISFGSEDHGHEFGLSKPLDGEEDAQKLLGGRQIARVVVDQYSADLTLHFDAETRIDIFNNSSSYEGWQANWTYGGHGITMIALGGGGFSISPT